MGNCFTEAWDFGALVGDNAQPVLEFRRECEQTGTDRPTKYPPVTGAEFLRSRLEPTYAARQARG
jgi:hypothetical protein